MSNKTFPERKRPLFPFPQYDAISTTVTWHLTLCRKLLLWPWFYFGFYPHHVELSHMKLNLQFISRLLMWKIRQEVLNFLYSSVTPAGTNKTTKCLESLHECKQCFCCLSEKYCVHRCSYRLWVIIPSCRLIFMKPELENRGFSLIIKCVWPTLVSVLDTAGRADIFSQTSVQTVAPTVRLTAPKNKHKVTCRERKHSELLQTSFTLFGTF